mmetsp:Transcript_34575/g.75497  ORF Transcript_34575/g.75497 Transcript_34575/m.75497 type:complete len:352 (+) Transcript_34575:82-1137(+)
MAMYAAGVDVPCCAVLLPGEQGLHRLGQGSHGGVHDKLLHLRHRGHREGGPQHVLADMHLRAQRVDQRQFQVVHRGADQPDDVEEAHHQTERVPEAMHDIRDDTLSVQRHEESGGLDGYEGVEAQGAEIVVGHEVAAQRAELIERVEAQHRRDVGRLVVFDAHGGAAVLGAVQAGHIVGQHVEGQHRGGEQHVLDDGALKRPQQPEEVHGHGPAREHDCVQSVLLPDDHGAVQDAARDDVEDERAHREQQVHQQRGVVEPAAGEAQRAGGGVHPEVAVQEAEHAEEPQRLVQLRVVLVGEQLEQQLLHGAVLGQRAVHPGLRPAPLFLICLLRSAVHSSRLIIQCLDHGSK